MTAVCMILGDEEGDWNVMKMPHGRLGLHNSVFSLQTSILPFPEIPKADIFYAYSNTYEYLHDDQLSNFSDLDLPKLAFRLPLPRDRWTPRAL